MSKTDQQILNNLRNFPKQMKKFYDQIRENTKLKFYETIPKSILPYGCKRWLLKRTRVRSITFEISMLQRCLLCEMLIVVVNLIDLEMSLYVKTGESG